MGSLLILGLAFVLGDVDQAAGDLHGIVTREIETREEAEQRRADVRRWIEKWGTREGDEFDFLQRVAEAHVSRHDSAPLLRLLEGVRAQGVPRPEFRAVVGDRLMWLGVRLTDAGDWSQAQELLPTLLEYSDDHLSSLWLMGRRGRDHDDESGPLFLQKVIIPAILADPAIVDADRVYLLRRLYEVEYTGPRPFLHVEGPDLDGKKRSSADYEGQVLLVMYWASW